MRPGEALESLSRDQLLELIAIYSKNWLAMDGVWFQSVERKYGMEEAAADIGCGYVMDDYIMVKRV